MNLELKPCLVIGSGRLATHLYHYFSLLHVDFKTWNRKNTFPSLKDLLRQKPLVILAIADDALENFYEDHLSNQSLTVVHCSGSHHSNNMISCHPLMTFGRDLYNLDIYKNIHFAVTGAQSLQKILPFLPNSSFQLNVEDKALYHALCVLSAAGAQKIWSLSEKLLSEVGVPTQALHPYMKQISENYINSGREALTGPWVRKDENTISQNLKALSLKSDRLNKIYELLKEGHYDNS